MRCIAGVEKTEFGADGTSHDYRGIASAYSLDHLHMFGDNCRRVCLILFAPDEIFRRGSSARASTATDQGRYREGEQGIPEFSDRRRRRGRDCKQNVYRADQEPGIDWRGGPAVETRPSD